MKFKLKQPTKFMHEGLENEDDESQNDQLSNQNDSEQRDKKQGSTTYKKKKIIKKKNEPSATRLNKINQTFENIYNNSSKLFADLNIDFDKLKVISEIKDRGKCLCNKNTKFYCLKCMQKVCREEFPSVELPFDISIIHHESQKINKSSAIPLQFLTKAVKIYSFSSLDENRNTKLWTQLPKPDKGVFILFPHKSSKLVQQIFQRAKGNEEKVVKHLIILDCTWFQTDQLLQILKARGYNQYVRIQGYKSIYWRYNHHNDEALSSAQSLAFFMRQFQKSNLRLGKDIKENQQIGQNSQKSPQKQVKKYDNLLFLYCLNLKMILKDQESRNQPKSESQPKMTQKE